MRRPNGATVPTDAAAPTSHGPITGAADVLCDKSGRLGLLSYQVPDGMRVRPGDAVQVPFGKRTAYGMVVQPGDPDKATRAIEEVFGKRATPADLALASKIARFHFSDVASVFSRLAPTSGRGADPLQAGPVTLSEDLDAPPAVRGPALDAPRRLLLRAPLVDPAVLAAYEAARLAATAPGGQILVLCPTAALVKAVRDCFTSGAARLDSRAPSGAWKGFSEGGVTIGIGTRSAALYSAAHLAGIVVVEEDHPGHLESKQPHTHARDVASARSRALRVPLTLVSANPTPQALGAGVAVLTVGLRPHWPRMRLINRAALDPVTRWAPPQLMGAIRGEQKEGRTPVVVVQRKAAVRRCVRCGEPRLCGACESSLCRHPEPSACPRCDVAAGVRMCGWDKARVTDLLGGDVHAVTLAELADVRDAGLVVIFDIDAALSAPELIPDSLAAGLILAAVRAAGPGGGGVIALTDDPHQDILDDLFTRRDQATVAHRALTAAKQVGLPPFGRLVTVRCGQAKQPSTDRWPGTIHGPRRVGTEWEILVRIPSEDLLRLEPHMTRLRRGGKTRITVS